MWTVLRHNFGIRVKNRFSGLKDIENHQKSRLITCSNLALASSQSGDVLGVFTTVRSPSGCDSFSEVIACDIGGGDDATVVIFVFGKGDSGWPSVNEEKSSFGIGGWSECSLGEAGFDSDSTLKRKLKNIAIEWSFFNLENLKFITTKKVKLGTTL